MTDPRIIAEIDRLSTAWSTLVGFTKAEHIAQQATGAICTLHDLEQFILSLPPVNASELVNEARALAMDIGVYDSGTVQTRIFNLCDALAASQAELATLKEHLARYARTALEKT